MDAYSPSHPTDQDMEIESDNDQEKSEVQLSTNVSQSDPNMNNEKQDFSEPKTNSSVIYYVPNNKPTTDSIKCSEKEYHHSYKRNSPNHRSRHSNHSRSRRSRSRSYDRNGRRNSRSTSRSRNRRSKSRSRERHRNDSKSSLKLNSSDSYASSTPAKPKRVSRFHSGNFDNPVAKTANTSQPEVVPWRPKPVDKHQPHLDNQENIAYSSNDQIGKIDSNTELHFPSNLPTASSAPWSSIVCGNPIFAQQTNVNIAPNLGFNQPSYPLLNSANQSYPPPPPPVLPFPGAMPPNFLQFPPAMMPRPTPPFIPNTNLAILNTLPSNNPVNAISSIPTCVTNTPPPPPPPPPPTQTVKSTPNLLETLMSKAGLSCSTLSDVTSDNTSYTQTSISSPIKQINKLLSSAANCLLNQLTGDNRNNQSTPDPLPPPPPPPLPGHVNSGWSQTTDRSYPLPFIPPPLPNIADNVKQSDNDKLLNGADAKKHKNPFENMNLEEVLAKRKRYDFATLREWQERIALEVKSVLKSAYFLRKISKEDYKEIMKKAVTKISRSGTSSINTEKITIFVKLYIDKYHKLHKLRMRATAKQQQQQQQQQQPVQ